MKTLDKFSINTVLLVFLRLGISIVFMILAFSKLSPLVAASMLFGWWTLDGILGIERLHGWFKCGPPELLGADEEQYNIMLNLISLSLLELIKETFWAWCLIFAVYLLAAWWGGIPLLYAMLSFILAGLLLNVYSHARFRSLREEKGKENETT